MFETIQTPSLSSPEILAKLDKTKFLICDVDYTVSDFGAGNVSGNRKIRDVLGDDVADEMDIMFDLILRGHRNLELLSDQEKRKYKEIMNKIELYTPKYWCREVYLILINEKYKLNLSPIEIMNAADIYWRGISETLQYYPDAVIFLNKAKELSIPLMWMTGSDSRTKVSKNYNDEWSIVYDPEYSKNKKMVRIAGMMRDFPGLIEIGDPVDKPEPEFYDTVFAHTKGINYEDILVVGDSEINDLENARKRGCRTVLIER